MLLGNSILGQLYTSPTKTFIMYQRMFSYSIWARKHRSAAITLIVVFKILIAVLTFSLGFMVNIWGFVLPASFKWLIVAAGVAALVSYPTVNRNAILARERYYQKQKRMDFLLACLGGVLWFFVGNQTVQWAYQPVLAATQVSSVQYVEGSLTTRHQEAHKQSSWGLKKIVQHKLKKQIEKIRSWDQVEDVALLILKLSLSFLTIVVAVLLGYWITGLACAIACAGGEVIAALVVILGWAGLLAGGFYAFKGIWYKWRRVSKSVK
ncbi:MAG: hypothetical protein WCR52_04725 [Bacteroidota bacterium]